MAAPLLSLAYPRLWRPNTVPTFPVVLDRVHPLAQRLRGMWDIGTARVPDYVNGADGTMTGGVVPISTVKGMAANFAAANPANGIDIPYAKVPWVSTATAFTISIWWRWGGQVPSVNGWHTLASSGSFGGGNFAWIVQDALSSNAWRLYVNGSQPVFGTWTTDQLWHNWTATFNASASACYIDGVLNSTGGGATFAAAAQNLKFGLDTSPFGLSGELSAPKVYDRVLSADQIAWLYAEPFAMLRPVSRRQYIVGATAVVPTADDFMFHPVF